MTFSSNLTRRKVRSRSSFVVSTKQFTAYLLLDRDRRGVGWLRRASLHSLAESRYARWFTSQMKNPREPATRGV